MKCIRHCHGNSHGRCCGEWVDSNVQHTNHCGSFFHFRDNKFHSKIQLIIIFHLKFTHAPRKKSLHLFFFKSIRFYRSFAIWSQIVHSVRSDDSIWNVRIPKFFRSNTTNGIAFERMETWSIFLVCILH